MIQSLNGVWRLYNTNHPEKYDIPADVPGSLYSSLLKEKLMADPYYRDNEYISTDICEDGCTYECRFDLAENMQSAEKILLRFDGIDTIADIALNGSNIGSANNMHREYVFDVTELIEQQMNVLTVKIDSPIRYIREKNEKTQLWGVSSTMAGYPHIRKAHYMYGWDWGPKLPDMGIWRSVSLMGVNGGMIDGIYVRQNHTCAAEGVVALDLDITLAKVTAKNLKTDITITAPDGTVTECTALMGGENKKTVSAVIENAKLWYPRGYGEHPLYHVKAELIDCDRNECIHSHEMNIGLRTVTVSTAPDENGAEFAFVVNGIKIFAMGANYIPEDQIIPNCSREKTEQLLRDCCNANFNMIRVWGGGYYPDDHFYELCDEMGLLVWQDFMFACSVYKADIEFCENIKHEFICNVKRLRNHPSLAMWCGNNEIESAWQYWGLPADPDYKKDYLRIFEVLIPKVLAFYDPVTFYWPSSPSSGGGFNDSGANNKGDSHYWDVWHGLKPFTEYFKYKFRFCSEYGFESIPSIKTVRSFAKDCDMNLTCPVMEAHQKCEAGSEKIMYYLAQMSHYPYDFEGLIYATQMVQSDAVRLNVENMRRNRGICMGSLYWQVNDSNPVISWSSIDYFHRWKALHYNARKFYAPTVISADTSDMNAIKLNISTERLTAFTPSVRWRSRLNTGEIIAQGSADINVAPLSAADHIVLTPNQTRITENMKNCAYIEFSLVERGIKLSGGTCMLVEPKRFKFVDPELSFTVNDMGSKFRIELSAMAFAKGVCIDIEDDDCIFSDNWFDMHADTVNIYCDRTKLSQALSPEEFAAKLRIRSYFEALQLGSRQ